MPVSVPPFTIDTVRLILDLSEGTTTADGRWPGHAIRKHVDLSNRRLHTRLLEEDALFKGVPMFTKFLSIDDMASAVTQALNTDDAIAKLTTFYEKRSANCELRNIVLTNSVKVRMAVMGEKRSTLLDASFVTIYVHRHPARPRSIHIGSAFASVDVV